MKSAFRVLLAKELLDVLRDRRTLAVTLLVPVLLYPGVLLLVSGAMSLGQQRLAREELTVAVASAEARALLESVPAPPHTTFVAMGREAAEAAMAQKEVGAVVEVAAGAEVALRQGQQVTLSVRYTKKQDRSLEAKERVARLAQAMGKATLLARLQELKVPAQYAEPVVLEAVDVDFERELGPLVASRALPMMLLLMLLMGAMYPAVDLTAGEKERGTLETLLVAPVRPVDVMAAKYVTVALTATAAAFANLGAMAVTFAIGVSAGPEGALSMRLSVGQLATLVVCLVPAAFMAAGLALAVASLARSFREGQSLMTPLVVVALVPGLVAVMPGVELTPLTAAVPLLNLALLVKATILGAAPASSVAIVVASVAVCSYGSLRLAANAFASEALRFGGTESWKELFFRNERRR